MGWHSHARQLSPLRSKRTVSCISKLWLFWPAHLCKFSSQSGWAVMRGSFIGTLSQPISSSFLPLSFAAEHGAFYKENGVWHKNVHAQEWSPGLLSILKLFVSKTPRSHLEVKETALAWHYRETDAWLGRLRAQQLVNSLISICLKQNLQIMQGNKVIEIKSPEFTKGSEVNRLLLATRYDFILAMGDDTTDDDMFKALPVTAVTVKIGTASESARYNLPVQTDTLPFLQRMTDKSVVKAALKSGLKGQLSSAIDFLKRIINH